METRDDDDWLDCFTFMEDVSDVSLLVNFPFDLHRSDESEATVDYALSDKSDISEITDVCTASTTTYAGSNSLDITIETKEQEVKTHAVTKKKKKGPVSKYRASNAQQRIPNLSRARPTVLYAFPSFDKCDSLLFFPTSLSRLSNSGDLAGMAKLFKTHCNRNCVTVTNGISLDVIGTLKMFEIINMRFPDSMECVAQTKVIENTIEATLVAKYTESNALYNTVRNQLRGTLFEAFLGGSRSELLRNATFDDAAAQEEFRASTLPDSGMDFTVNANFRLKLTFDDRHRKVTRMEYSMSINTIQPISSDG
jgi:hypothetical protein